MGCNLTRQEYNGSPIKIQIESPKIVQAHSSHFQTLQNRENSSTNVKKKIKRVNSAKARFMSPPIGRINFIGTMPYSLILERLRGFHRQVLDRNQNFAEIVEYIRATLIKIADNFDDPSLKIIKASNKKLKKNIGNYTQGILFMGTLGFRDCEDYIEFDSNQTVSNIRFKIKQFEHAVNTVSLSKTKSQLS